MALRLLAQLVTVKRLNETTMDLEQIIDELVYRKRTASDAERQAHRSHTGLRYSYEDAGGISRSIKQRTNNKQTTLTPSGSALKVVDPLPMSSIEPLPGVDFAPS